MSDKYKNLSLFYFFPERTDARNNYVHTAEPF